MNFDLKKLAPWNWFKKEQQEAQQSAGNLPVARSQAPGTLSSLPNCVWAPDRDLETKARGQGCSRA